MDSMLSWLESAGLQKFYPRFKARGVTEENFVDLQLEDYAELGVVDQNDRHKLFRLKQIIKQEMDVVVKNQAAARRLNNGLSNLAAAINAPAQPSAAAHARERAIAEAAHEPFNVNRPAAQQQQQAPSQRRVSEPSDIDLYGDDDFLAPVAPMQGRRAVPKGAAAGVAAGGINMQPSHQAPQQQQYRPAQQQQQQQQRPVEEDDDEYNDEDEAEESYVENRRLSGGPADGEEKPRKSKISVVVRKRPLNGKELKNQEVDILTVRDKLDSVVVHEPKIKVDLTKYTNNVEFTFDGVFDTEATNAAIYRRTAYPLIEHLFKKGKATCFAYGQTGSGKTFTMMGPGTNAPYEHQGLYLQAARDIFALIARPEFSHLTVIVSFFEIYGGKLFDLLNGRQKLVAREDGNQQCNVVGLTEKPCQDINALLRAIDSGNAARSTGVTGANIDSSRSHAILQITLKNRDKLHGKFSFIDLAGSERAADTANNDRQTRLEGADINQSLLALKECIRALDQGAKHLPFRQSKLTQVLKDSFVGNSRTVMIATVSPNNGACEHTLNTLRYAYRVKELKSAGPAGQGVQNAYMPHSYLVQQEEAQAVQAQQQQQYIRQQQVEQQRQEAMLQQQQHAALAKMKAGGAPSQIPVPRQSSQPQLHQPQQYNAPQPVQPQQQQPQQQQRRRIQQPTEYADDDDDDGVTPSDDRQQEFTQTHNAIASKILEDEEDLVDAHRRQIDETMKLVKEEMDLLRRFDKMEIKIDDYISALDSLIERKIRAQGELRERLNECKRHLAEEETLSSSFKKHQMQQQMQKMHLGK